MLKQGLSRVFDAIILLYAGIMPIILSLIIIHSILAYFLCGHMSEWWGSNTPNSIMIIYFSALCLAIKNNYCRYLSMLIASIFLIALIVSQSGILTNFIPNIVYHLIIIALIIFAAYNLVIVFIHILKQIDKHTKKIRILLKAIAYAISQRISRRIRRATYRSSRWITNTRKSENRNITEDIT